MVDWGLKNVASLLSLACRILRSYSGISRSGFEQPDATTSRKQIDARRAAMPAAFVAFLADSPIPFIES
jgi:hypothetical protein